MLENGAWYVQFNEANGKPHTAFGKPILVSGSNPEEQARYFVEHQLQGFGIPTEELELMTITSNAHFNQVFFKQAHQGKEVLASRLSVKLTLDALIGRETIYGSLVIDGLDSLLNLNGLLSIQHVDGTLKIRKTFRCQHWKVWLIFTASMANSG